MNERLGIFILLCLLAVAAGFAGCGRTGAGGRGSVTPAESLAASGAAADLRRIQAVNMSFADRYLAAMADQYDRAKLSAKTPQGVIMAQRLEILAGTGVMTNAVDPNPIVGLMDMAVMVTLTRQIAQDKWVAEMFGRETADAMVAALKVQEADIWQVAGTYLTPRQVDDLHKLAARWRAAHPDQRYVAGARLADFVQATPGAAAGPAGGAVQELAGGALGLVSLDPFKGLDPALKEVTETRVMAERFFFYMRHAPILMSWQTDTLFDQMLAQPQMMQLFTDTNTVAGSTTRFSEATTQFSGASADLANTVEKFRLQLPEQQARLVSELDDVIARQRVGAMTQATTQVSLERDATLVQIGATVTAQQDLMTRNLQGLTDQAIDRAFERARSLVLVTVTSILLAFIVYRLFASMRKNKALPSAR